MTALVVMLLATLTAGAAFLAAEHDERERGDRQRGQAQRVGVLLERTTSSPMRQAETISWALSGTDRAPGATFDALARRALPGQPLVSAIALADRRTDGGATTYVTRRHVARSSGAGDLARRTVAVAGDDPRSAALRAVERVGTPRATSILPTGLSSLAVYSPVLDDGERVSGAVLTVYDTSEIVGALRRALPRTVPFTVSMAGRPLPGAGAPPADGITERVTMAGQPFEVVVGRSQGVSWLLIAVLGIGGVVTVCLGILTFQIQRREAWAMRLVDRRLAERDAAEERFSAAFSHAPIGMALVALDGEILQANAAFATMIGAERGRLAGRPIAEVLVPAERPWVSESLGMLEPGLQRVVHAERRCLHADGHIVWTAVSLTLTRDGTGAPEHLLAQFEDISDRRRYEAHLKHLADHDPLTGLYNRRAFERELDRHLERVREDGARGAAIVVDVDHFKQINDLEGHHAGDDLIKAIARGLRQRVRLGDVLARLGGDEFAVLMREGGIAEARHLANVVLDAIREQHIVTSSGRTRAITGSAGIALFDGREDATGETILVDADLAMYDAKEAGRDRIAEAAPAEDREAGTRTRLTWMDRIRDALDDERFVLYAQPIVSLETGDTEQYELLLRMRDEDGQVIPPGAFLSVAERSGLIGRIDRWVVTRAIDLLAASGAGGPTFEVNLSGSSIGDEVLLELIEQRLRETGVNPRRLVFEITETVAVADVPRAQAFAARLNELGCRFALDDFGSGFGSFYYLKHLPFDFLKIDGEFVRDCARDQTDRLIISAAVDIARGLGKRTIAEVIEDDGTWQALRDLGVDDGQGFYLGRPEPVENVIAAHQRQAS
ncbi:MAG: EAL domain-containing protein [Solirubrobacteraceae bacterium]|nr:EAL domain-containing protein [Solirubrobacteraceae bacterium]